MEQLDYTLYDAWFVPFWRTPLFFYSVVCICVMSLVVLIVGVWVWWHARPRIVAPVVPWEHAQQRLCQLLEVCEKTPVEQLVPKYIYGQLTDILKEYFQARYAYNFVGATDRQVIQMLEQYAHEAQVHEVQSVLSGATLVKFAQETSVQEYMLRDIKRGISIVEHTKSDEIRLHS